MKYEKQQKLKVAFLGGAHSSAAGRLHRTAIELDHRFEVVAGCFSRNIETNRVSADIYGVDPDRVYADLARLLDAEISNIDAIVILTPTDQHFEQILRIRDAGVAVICEKAMVSELSQAHIVGEQYKANKDFLAVTYNYTGYPMLRELKAIIDSGSLGQVTQIRAEMPQEGYIKKDLNQRPIVPQEWRLRDGLVPTISLDLGVHLHLMIKFLVGAVPERVVALQGSKGNFDGLTDTVKCLARYSKGIDCSMWFTKAALGHRNGMKIEIYGSLKSAIWIQENPEQLFIADATGNKLVLDRATASIAVADQPRYSRFKAGHPAGFVEAFANYYSDVADSLKCFQRSGIFEESSYVFGANTAIEGIEFLDAVARSAANEAWVELRR